MPFDPGHDPIRLGLVRCEQSIRHDHNSNHAIRFGWAYGAIHAMITTLGIMIRFG